MPSEITKSRKPTAMSVPWFTAMPMSVSAEDAMAMENGLTVEPRVPRPAPSSTMSAPTMESKPMAKVTEASRM